MSTRVGVYIDGFNVYYGARMQFRESPGSWKWYSPRALAGSALNFIRHQPNFRTIPALKSTWSDASLERVVFCTAKLSAAQSESKLRKQQSFLNAIEKGGFIDELALGRYVSRIKYAPLAIKDAAGNPRIFRPSWPVMIQDSYGEPLDDATYLVSYFHNEEKGSDVNVATHMIRDVYEERVNAVILPSNDSDLTLPVSIIRGKVPVGVVNPFYSPPHRSLTDGMDAERGDWFCYLSRQSFLQSQMPPTVDGFSKPANW